ncbi:transposable element Tcb2 transposase [Trichonephila clavipes]|nr:transposable element Tcb2 transposase [Trichonephila clavipes]
MQRDCALRIAGRGRLMWFSVEYKTGNQSLFECAESLTKIADVDIPLRRFRRQYEQLSLFEKERIIGMMEAGWSARRVVRQLGGCDCVVRRCWDQWIRERCHLREEQAKDDRPVVKKTGHIVRNARVQLTASSAVIQAQVAPSLGAPMSSRTIRRRRTFGIAAPITCAALDAHPSTHPFEWCRARANCSEMEPSRL